MYLESKLRKAERTFHFIAYSLAFRDGKKARTGRAV